MCAQSLYARALYFRALRFCDRFTARLQAAALLAVAMAAGVLGFATPAAAALNACNKTSYVLEVAIGFEARERAVSRGWYQLEPGQCRALVEGPLQRETYYTFAHSLPIYNGDVKYFAGAQAFCAEAAPQDFNIPGRNNCDKRGFIERRFARIETNGGQDWTTNFTEPADYTLEEARIAGVQRLLQDIGASDAPVDGFRGAKTNKAVQAFKDKRGLGNDTALPSTLYAALIKSAHDVPKSAGFRFCNETDQIVWGAVGYEGNGDPISTGWFKVPPKSCTQAIKERLRAKAYYSYAEADRKSGGLLSWGGDQNFCTSDDRFVIKGREACEKRGYSSTGFLKIETKGNAEIVQTLTSEGALTRRGSSR